MARDRGSTGLVVIVSAFAMMTMSLIALSDVAVMLVERQRAQTAADAAALAGIIDGRGAATELAAAHGGIITEFEVDGDEVTVVVVLGDATATARATDGP